MGLHEFIYKLVGNSGTILEIGPELNDTSRWQALARSAAPFVEWRQIDLGQAADANDDPVIWLDTTIHPSKIREIALQEFLQTPPQRLVVIARDQEDDIAEFLNSLNRKRLYASSITRLLVEQSNLCAISVSKYDSEASSLHCRALSELAVLHYLDAASERVELRRVLEQQEKQLLQKDAQLIQLKTANEHSRQWQVKAEDMADRLLALTHQLEEREDAYKELENRASQYHREMNAHKKRAADLACSFSYRFGNLFALSIRSPKSLALLPFRIIGLVFGAAINLARRRRRKRRLARQQRNSAPLRAAVQPVANVESPRFDAELQAFMGARKRADRETVATIFHPLTGTLLAPQPSMFQVHPNTWQADLENAEVLVVDAWMLLSRTPWQHTLAGSPLSYPGHLLDVLEHCRAKKIPSLLLLTCRPDEYAVLVDTMPLFSHVIAPAGVNLNDVSHSLGGQTTIVRSGWPIAAAHDARDVGNRRFAPSGVLRIRNGEVLLQESGSGQLQEIAPATEAAAIDEVFGRPLLLDSDQPDLRIMELLAKGAVPIMPPGMALIGATSYRFVEGRAPEAWQIIDDDPLRLEIARHNVITAATLDSSERIRRTIAQLAYGQSLQTVENKLNALVLLEDAAHIPMLTATLKRQVLLPGRIVVFPAPSVDAQSLAQTLTGQLPAGVTLDVAEDMSGIADYLRRSVDGEGRDSWQTLLSSECHYGNNYFAAANALARSGIAQTFGKQEGGKIDTATLVFSPDRCGAIAELLSNTYPEEQQLDVPASLLPIGQATALNAEFHRLGQQTRITLTV